MYLSRIRVLKSSNMSLSSTSEGSQVEDEESQLKKSNQENLAKEKTDVGKEKERKQRRDKLEKYKK